MVSAIDICATSEPIVSIMIAVVASNVSEPVPGCFYPCCIARLRLRGRNLGKLEGFEAASPQAR